MRDNDEVFIDKLLGTIESIDELSSIEIINKESSYHFRIAPSIPKYLEPILYEILTFVNMFGIKLTLGKSMKTSSIITFDIDISL
jgi:hypothetical protein